MGKKSAENIMDDEKKLNPAENELTRFRRDLSRVAFSDEYAIDYAETVTTLLQAAATITGCEDLNIDALCNFFRAEAERAQAYDEVLDELADLENIASHMLVGEA